MVVRLEDPGNAQAVLVGQPEIVLDLPLRIDDDCLAAVRDDVRGAAQVFVQELPEEHAFAYPGWSSRNQNSGSG